MASPGKRRPATTPGGLRSGRSAHGAAGGGSGAAKGIASARSPSPTKQQLRRTGSSSDDSDYGCAPTSKYGWAGGGAHKAGVLNSIKVSEVEEPPPPPPRVSTGPTPVGAPFKLDPSGWGLIVQPREEAERKLYLLTNRRWCELRGRQLRPEPLSYQVEHLIKEWFELVDHDHAGSFDIHKLQAALQAAEIPFTEDSLHEMVEIMDFKGLGTGVVQWKEFHTFISYQVHAGQDLLGGMLVLPSGLGLPLGTMIHKMRRSLIMDQYFQGGDQRKEGVARAQAHLNMAKGGVHSEEETKAGTNAKQGQAREKSRSRERASSARFHPESTSARPASPLALPIVPDSAPSASDSPSPRSPLSAQSSPGPSNLQNSMMRPGQAPPRARPRTSPMTSHTVGSSPLGLTRSQQQEVSSIEGQRGKEGVGEGSGGAAGAEGQQGAGVGCEGGKTHGEGTDILRELAHERELLRYLVEEKHEVPSATSTVQDETTGLSMGDGDAAASTSGGGGRGHSPRRGLASRQAAAVRTIVQPASANTLRAASSRLAAMGRSTAPVLPSAVHARYLDHFQTPLGADVAGPASPPPTASPRPGSPGRSGRQSPPRSSHAPRLNPTTDSHRCAKSGKPLRKRSTSPSAAAIPPPALTLPPSQFAPDSLRQASPAAASPIFPPSFLQVPHTFIQLPSSSPHSPSSLPSASSRPPSSPSFLYQDSRPLPARAASATPLASPGVRPFNPPGSSSPCATAPSQLACTTPQQRAMQSAAAGPSFMRTTLKEASTLRPHTAPDASQGGHNQYQPYHHLRSRPDSPRSDAHDSPPSSPRHPHEGVSRASKSRASSASLTLAGHALSVSKSFDLGEREGSGGLDSPSGHLQHRGWPMSAFGGGGAGGGTHQRGPGGGGVLRVFEESPGTRGGDMCCVGVSSH